MNEHEDQAQKVERLNRYVDTLNAGESTAGFEVRDGEEATLWRMACLLEAAAHPERMAPRPEFAADLERRLLARQVALTPAEPRIPWWRQLREAFSHRRWAAVGAMAALVTLLLLLGPFLIEHLSPRSPMLPSLVGVAQAYGGLEGLPALPGLLGDVSLELGAPLPKAPERLTVYRQISEPLTATEAEALAARFGIQGIAHRVGESFVVEDEDGRLVVHRLQRGYYRYRNLQSASLPSAPPVEASKAARRAEAFLREWGLLEFDYELQSPEVLPSDEGTSRYRVTFVQRVDGRPVENAGVTATVDRAGRVIEVAGRVLGLEPVGLYPIRPAEEAYATLQDGDPSQPFLVDVRRGKAVWLSTVVVKTVEAPPLAPLPHQPGDHVELEGLLSATVFEDADGKARHVLAFLATETHTYLLVGPEVEGMARYDRLHLRVWGTMVADNRGEPALLVQDYQRSRPQERFVTLLGQLILDRVEGREHVLLLADDGTRYVLLPWGQNKQGIAHFQKEGQLGRRTLVGGTLTGERSAEGYPLLEGAGIMQGTEIDQLESATEKPWPRPAVVPDAIPRLSGRAVVDDTALIYFALPVPLAPSNRAATERLRYVMPVYRFRGQAADGTAFIAWVEAVQPHYLRH